MPSTFRSSRSGRQFDSNRTRTGQIDHDVFEGLPVRRWSRQTQTHSQVPKTEDSEFVVQGPGGTGRLPELAMPRDSQLLGASSRALLRAARAGCIYIHQNTHNAEEDEKESREGDDGATGGHPMDRSFTSRKWMTIPKHLEPAEVEFLAKRRPGLPSLYGGASAADGSSSGPGPMRRTKFQKMDPLTGNISIYEAWVPEGHRIEGEVTGDIQTIAEQSNVPINSETPAPGTVVEGVGVVNSEGVVVAEAGSASVMTPPKRRPPPPKRKGKGIGKGRKKKVMFAPGEGVDAATVHGVPQDPNSTTEDSKEAQDTSQTPIDQTGQDDDEDDGEDGEDSDEGDDVLDAKTPETPQAPSVSESADHPTDHPTIDASIDTKDIEMADVASESQASDLGPPPAKNQESSSLPSAAVSTLTQDKTLSLDMDSHPSTSTPPPAVQKIHGEAVAHTEQPNKLLDSAPVDSESFKPFGESLQPGTSAKSTMALEHLEDPMAHEAPALLGPATATQSIPADAVQPTTEVTASVVNTQPTQIGQDATPPVAFDFGNATERSQIHPSANKKLESEATAGELTHSISAGNPLVGDLPISNEHQDAGQVLVSEAVGKNTVSLGVPEPDFGSEDLKDTGVPPAPLGRDENSPQLGGQCTTDHPAKRPPSPRIAMDSNVSTAEATDFSRAPASASGATDQSKKENAPASESENDELARASTDIAISGGSDSVSRKVSLSTENAQVKESASISAEEQDPEPAPLSTS